MTIAVAVRPTQQRTTVSSCGARIGRTIGNEPAFACIVAEPILAGWYELELDLEVVKGRICNPCLYPDYGNGVFEHQKIDLPVDVSPFSLFHTSELQSLMRISYAVFCLKKKKTINKITSMTH